MLGFLCSSILANTNVINTFTLRRRELSPSRYFKTVLFMFCQNHILVFAFHKKSANPFHPTAYIFMHFDPFLSLFFTDFWTINELFSKVWVLFLNLYSGFTYLMKSVNHLWNSHRSVSKRARCKITNSFLEVHKLWNFKSLSRVTSTISITELEWIDWFKKSFLSIYDDHILPSYAIRKCN